MDDKKLNNTNNPDNVNNPINSKDDSIDFLTQKAKEEKSEFGSAGHDDINKNLGSFGNTVVKQEQPTPEVKLDVDAKVVEQAAKEKINFERFTKTKRAEKAAKTKFGERVSIMLRSKKGFRTTWILEIVIMLLVIAISACFIGLLTRYVGAKPTGQEGGGPVCLPEVQQPLKVGLVFAWISLFPCVIPLIYLVTAWFIGINQVASSRLYHYMFWICLGVSVLCFLVGMGCLIGPMHQIDIYPPFL